MSKVLNDARASSSIDRMALTSLLAATAVLPVLAVVAEVWVFAAALAVAFTLEWLVARRAPAFMDILRRVQFSTTVFTLLRQSATLLAVALSGVLSTAALATLVCGIAAAHGARALVSALHTYIDGCRRLPVATRNVDVSQLRIPDAPKSWQLPTQRRLQFEMDMPIAAGAILAVGLNAAAAVALGCAAALLIQAGRAAVLLRHAKSNRHLRDKRAVLDVTCAQVRQSQPEVALYFTGTETSAYQIDMWLRTLEQLERPAVIVMRERVLLQRIAPTNVPTVCIPDNIDLMNFELPSIHTALYPGNAGKNIHMLRVPGVTHVFIGHGDSDKPASFNPFSKVYNEIWTAGKAGRDRYRAADVGVDDRGIREVGRPQLQPVHRFEESEPAETATVLYAPTWEGWTADLEHTSLLRMGPALVQLLLDGDVRVLYKPHPLTGTRDGRTLAAHRRISALLRAANRRNGVAAAVPEGLSRVEARIAQLSAVAPGADEAQRSRDYGHSRPDLGAEVERLRADWHREYWTAAAPRQHHVVDSGTLPSLYELFNQADLLITDVSSVVSDFIASEKPYMVCNPAGHDHDEFKAANSTVRGGYLLDADYAGLDEVLRQVRKRRADPGHCDPLAAERRQLREYLLGPDQPSATERFRHAVAQASAAAEGARRAAE